MESHELVKGRDMRWLWRQIRPLLDLQWIRLFLIALWSGLAIVDPLIIKWLIDDLLPWRKEGLIPIVVGAFFMTYALRYALDSLGRALDFYAGERIAFGVRLGLLRHLQALSAEYHDRTAIGETLHRFEQDAERIGQTSGSLVSTLVRSLCVAAATILVMSLLSVKLTLLVLPLFPAFLVLRRYGVPRLRAAAEEAQRRSGARSGFLQDHLTGIVQVQLLNAQARERRRYFSHAKGVLAARLRLQMIDLLLRFASSLVTVGAITLVLGLGGQQVLAGALTIGGLVAYFTYLDRLFDPVQSLVDVYTGLQKTRASIARVLDVLDAEPAVREPARPEHLPAAAPGAVEIAEVTFAYDPGRPILRGVSCRIAAGEKVALVGFSGCGKSTLARLIARVYDPASGRITIDGLEVRQLALRELRSRVVLVPQEPVLFDVSLEDNLLYANPEATSEELRRALAIVQLDDLIDRSPEGWSLRVGPMGRHLSGGQRQRLALARAILQSPRVLILDEATSALDGPTERRLLDALDLALAGVTKLAIAHRLALPIWADRVLVLEGGKIVAQGTHQELYRAGGLYRRICDEQFPTEITLIDFERQRQKVTA